MITGETIDYDLENSPLFIKTKSEVGSYEKVQLEFFSAAGDGAGRIYITFGDNPDYQLWGCTTLNNHWDDFLNPDPFSETDKILKIALTRSSDMGVKLVISCNKEEVLNLQISSSTCREATWENYWNYAVKKIKFNKWDSASVKYSSNQPFSPGKIINQILVFLCSTS